MDSSFFTNIIEFALENGILIKTSKNECTNLPFAIFPSPIPKIHFEELNRIQPEINKLMYLASQDHQFLSDSLKSVLEVDEFTRNLFSIYEKVNACKTKSEFELGILRSDYMFDCDPANSVLFPKQIEINAIAAGLGGLGGSRIKAVQMKALRESNRSEDIASMPNNPSTYEIARGLIEGWNAYGNPKSSIVFLITEPEPNVFDQRATEYEINSINDRIPVRRRTVNDIISDSRLTNDGKLFIKDEEAAVVYFRTGYSPRNFPTQQHWDARLTIEKSKAIKCPSVALQLVGCKKFQEIFARPGAMERFISNKEAVAAIKKTFAGLYTLDINADGDRAMEMALKSPENFVLKPQREGGGNNIYGKDIVSVLKEIGRSDKRTTYILMDRVRPKSTKNHFAVNYAVSECDCVSELGIFGVFLGKDGKLTYNRTAGHILRSKAEDVDEGGLMTGTAVLDIPLLV